MNRFLVIRFSSIGDVILATPLLRCLRTAFPDCQIDFLVKQEFAGVLAGNPHINEVITFDKTKGIQEFRRVRALIRENNYHHIFDIQQNIRSILLSVGTKAMVTTFSKRLLKRFMLIRLRINTYREITPVFLRYFESAASLGVRYDGLGTEVFPPAGEMDTVNKLLSENAQLEGKPLIAIAPGARWANKRWPAGHFAAAANLIAANTGAAFVLIGGATDAENCHHVMQQLEADSVSTAGKLSLMGSAAMLQHCSLLLTNDTGMLHLAQAVKTPVVAVFGPTTRELGFFPIENNSRVAEIPLYCRPCTQKGLDTCPKQHFRCMLDLKPEQVAGLAGELLQIQ